MGRKVVRLNGVDIDVITAPEVRRRLQEFLSGTQTRHIVTVNPEFLAAAAEDERFCADLNGADLALADGFGIVLAAALTGQPVPGRITGHDIVRMVCELSQETGARVFLYGGEGSRAHRAAATLKKQYPGLQLAGADTEHRFWGWHIPEWTIRRRIVTSAPDILLVALGAGKQERWLRRNLPHLPSVKIGVGVGGVIDVLSGDVRRAPPWLQRVGLEWAFRLIQEPQRFDRIITATLRFPVSVVRFRYRK